MQPPSPPSQPNPHHLSTRQVVLAFTLTLLAVLLGYVIIDRSLKRQQRQRPQPMWTPDHSKPQSPTPNPTPKS